MPHTRSGIYKGRLAEQQSRQDTPVLHNQRRNAHQYAILFHLRDTRLLYLHHPIPSHFSQETRSPFPSWSQRSTHSRKCTGYALQEPVVDVLAVGQKL